MLVLLDMMGHCAKTLPHKLVGAAAWRTCFQG
jgi:hypothetical protein